MKTMKEKKMTEEKTMKYNEHSTVKDRPFAFVLLILAIIALFVAVVYLKDDKTLLLIDGVLIILAIAILLIWLLKNKANKLQINENNILFEVGLLSKDRSEVSIGQVRTVKIKQSFFNRIFSVGTIEIYTAGDNPEIVAKAMPNPHKVREIIKS
jgi:uncharacterized membrane protein YdbT with pleckstrin-like domain